MSPERILKNSFNEARSQGNKVASQNDILLSLCKEKDGLSKDVLDFVSNDLSTTWPPGMEVEVFKVAALEDSASRCDDAGIREHGTLYMRQNPNLYRLHNLEAPSRHRRPDLSLEVDVAEDLDVIKTILTVFGGRSDMTLSEIISYLERHPSLAARNRNVTRRWRQYRNDTREIKKDSRLN